MRLIQKDAEYFDDLFKKFILHCNKKLKILKNFDEKDDFLKTTPEKQMELRKKIYEKMNFYLDDFINSGLNNEESEIVKSWKHHVKSRFIMYKHLSNYTIFIDTNDNKVYGIFGILTDLEDLIPDYALPIMLETVILPFKNQITYSGIFSSFSLQFGSNIKKGFDQTYQEKKLSNEIITALPYECKKTQDEKDTDKIRFYLKDKKNADYYKYELEELKNKNELLNTIYKQEIGRFYSKEVKKKLKKLGLKKGFFAVIEDLVIASGENEEKLEKNLTTILAKDLRKFVYKFKI